MPKIKEGKKSKKSKKSTAATTGSGWGAVATKKKKNEEARENAGTFTPEFKVKDGESAVIQILNAEPICVDGYNLKNAKGWWKFFPTQLAVQKHCLMKEAGNKSVWRAAFKVLDFRGEWDKEAKDFKYDGNPVEKLWWVSNTVALQLKARSDKAGKPLNELVLEVSRTGSGPQDTAYNFGYAFDEETEKRIKPIKYKEEVLPPLEELVAPPTDEELISMGIGAPDDEDIDFSDK